MIRKGHLSRLLEGCAHIVLTEADVLMFTLAGVS